MRRITAALFLSAATLGSAPLPAAAWEMFKGENSVSTFQQAGNYSVTISCTRGRDRLGFTISDLDQSGDGFDRIEAVMIWITLPDGRTDKWSIIVSPEGPALSGPIAFSSQTLDFFGNGASFGITTFPESRKIFESDMKGTGAARIAFRERCGI